MLQEKYEKYLKRLEKERKEKTGYMSNAKWYKFFSAVEQLDIFLPQALMKFLSDNQTYSFYFGGGFDEKGILDGRNCPFLYKEMVAITK